jgi:hypothetical protein
MWFWGHAAAKKKYGSYSEISQIFPHLVIVFPWAYFAKTLSASIAATTQTSVPSLAKYRGSKPRISQTPRVGVIQKKVVLIN